MLQSSQSEHLLSRTFLAVSLTCLNFCWHQENKASENVLFVLPHSRCNVSFSTWMWNQMKTRNMFCRTWYLPHSRVHKSIAELGGNFGDSEINLGQIAYFSLRMRKTALFLLPVKNLTSPSCSPTPISYNTREFWISPFQQIWPSLIVLLCFLLV